MRIALLLAGVALLGACSPPPPKPVAEAPKADPTTEASYGTAVSELAALARQAESLLAQSKNDDAAAAITKGQAIAAQVLAAPHPTLAAMEAASDIDELYGRMLLTNKNYGWARMTFQKDRSRWTNWRPQTDETARRKKQAEAGIAACDRAMSQP